MASRTFTVDSHEASATVRAPYISLNPVWKNIRFSAQVFDPDRWWFDFVTLSDGLSFMPILAFNDAITIAEDIHYIYNPDLLDALAVSEVFSTTTNYIRALTDTTTIAEAFAIGFGPTLVDSMTLADAIAFTPAKSIADTFTMADAFSIQSIGSLLLSDTATITDAFTTAGSFNITLADSMTIADLFVPQSGSALLGGANLNTRQFNK